MIGGVKIRVLAKDAHLIKTCCKKILVMVAGKGLTKTKISFKNPKSSSSIGKHKTYWVSMLFLKNNCLKLLNFNILIQFFGLHIFNYSLSQFESDIIYLLHWIYK